MAIFSTLYLVLQQIVVWKVRWVSYALNLIYLFGFKCKFHYCVTRLCSTLDAVTSWQYLNNFKSIVHYNSESISYVCNTFCNIMYIFCVSTAKIKIAILLYKAKNNSGTFTTCTELSQLRTIHYSFFLGVQCSFTD